MQFIVIVFLQFHLWSSPCFNPWFNVWTTLAILQPFFVSKFPFHSPIPGSVSQVYFWIPSKDQCVHKFCFLIPTFYPFKPQQLIKCKLLLSIYSQLYVVQYGEFGRWSLVGVKVCLTTNSPNTVPTFCSGKVGRIKVRIFGAWRVNNVHWTLQVCSVLHLAALERGECR